MRPVDRLRQTADDIAYILERNGNGTIRWDAFRNALADRTPDGFSPGGEPGPRSTDVPDPTHGSVLARERPTHTWDEAETLLHRIHTDARHLAKLMTSVGEATIDNTQRCTGAPDQPWGRADCVNNSVRAGLCWACIKRGYRYSEDHDESYT